MITDLDIQRALRKTAEAYHQTPAQVRKNIRAMLDESRKSTDGQHKEAWEHIDYTGEEPSIEEVIRSLATKLIEQRP